MERDAINIKNKQELLLQILIRFLPKIEDIPENLVYHIGQMVPSRFSRKMFLVKGHGRLAGTSRTAFQFVKSLFAKMVAKGQS